MEVKKPDGLIEVKVFGDFARLGCDIFHLVVGCCDFAAGGDEEEYHRSVLIGALVLEERGERVQGKTWTKKVCVRRGGDLIA